MRSVRTRRVVQLGFVLAAAYAGVSLAVGWSRGGVERFCPFGGVEALWAVLTKQSFTCATGRFNLSLMVALLLSTVLVRKSFCSWICPVGTVSEWLAALSRRLPASWRRSRLDMGVVEPPHPVDRGLRGLRIVVLVVIVVATATTAELIFRPFDPYYVLFSANGHDVQWWSYPLLAGLLGLAVVVPMAWCRYLCPLGAVLWPGSRIGLLRVGRDSERCTSCGRCDRACPHGLQVGSLPVVSSGECTLCLDCVDVCPTAGALELAAPGKAARPVGRWTIPLVLALGIGLGLSGAGLLVFPSFEHRFVEAGDASAEVELIVAGVRCVDTAEQAAMQLDGVDGVIDVVAYASDARLVVGYDPAAIDVEAIVAALQSPVWDEASSSFLFGRFRVESRSPDATEPP
jgi:NAD-dependent dihydropyrimidine dehydrogenase PreA subunit